MNKKAFYGSSGDLFLFREEALMVVASVVSLLLQIISFFTTLDGAKAYFEATFAFAPLLFALAVQSVVYFLENGLRNRITFLKVVALMLAMCCSSYFSFVGIYNNINSPTQYLERTYNSYAKELTAMADEVRTKDEQSFTLAADNAVNYIISQYTELTSEKETLERLSDEINSAEGSVAAGMSAPKRYEYATYEEYAAAYSAYIAGVSQGNTAEQQAKIEALLNKYGITDTSEIAKRTADISAKISLIEGTLAAFGGEDFYMSAERMRAKVSEGDSSAVTKLSSLYLSLSGKGAGIPQYTGGKEGFSMPSYAELSNGDPAAVVRERLQSTVFNACDELNSAGINVDSGNYEFENIYTLPMYAVFSGEFGADAVVALLLAVLTDVLSLLFAMIFVRTKSALAVRNTDQAIVSDSRLFERNIVTALRLSMTGQGRRYSDEPEFDEIFDLLGEFVSLFYAVDIAAEKGYTMAADRDTLIKFQPLVAFLCQFGLAKQLSSEEAAILLGEDFSRDTVLLKTKFILWLSEKSPLSDKKQKPSAEKAVTA